MTENNDTNAQAPTIDSDVEKGDELSLEEGAVVALTAFGDKVRQDLTVDGCVGIGSRDAGAEVRKRVKPTRREDGHTLILRALRREI